MDANIVNLQTLFGQPVSFRIPQFQRPYAWSRSGQWESLWEDVRNLAESLVEPESAGETRPHFMGAIILQRQDSSTAEVDKRLVIDGQQRLTTLQLLIRAVVVAFQHQDLSDKAARLRNLTLNDENRWGGDDSNKTKIRQSNLFDQDAFRRAITIDEDPEGNSLPKIISCYSYFLKSVSEWLNSQLEVRCARASALEEVLSRHLQAAVIDLDAEEKPHVIFETLNARGEPLRQSDLIKNTVMYEAGVVDDSQKADELWGMFGDEWWRKDTKEQRINRVQIDRFLNYWVQMRSRKFLASERTAAEFRNYVDQKYGENKLAIWDIAEDIRNTGLIYQQMDKAEFPGIRMFLNRIKVVDVGVVMPLLLWLHTSEIEDERRSRVIKALESYLIRRMICGISVQGMSHLFLRLVERLSGGTAKEVDDIALDYLKNQTADQQIWPNDRIVLEELTTKAMRGNTSRKKMVMEAIELWLRNDFAENLGDTTNLTLEHVMPQRWSDQHWPLPTDAGEATEKRNSAVNAIGNLTLVTGKLNNSLSNGPWTEKRHTLSRHSGLFLNKRLLEQTSDEWDEDRIKERSTDLAEIVVKIWPYAGGIY